MRSFDAISQAPTRVDGSFFQGLKDETRFFLVRHGQSEGNAKGIIQGRLDLPLDQAGRAQARALAPWFAELSPEAIFSSTLIRAVETASIIAEACRGAAGERLDPRLDSRFAELDTGPFTGLSMEEASRFHPELYAGFLREGWDGVGGVEHSSLLYARALEAWELLRAEALGGCHRLVVVTHGGFLQWLIKATMGVREWMPLMPMGNCGVSEFVLQPQGSAGQTLALWRRFDFRPSEVCAAKAPLF